MAIKYRGPICFSHTSNSGKITNRSVIVVEISEGNFQSFYRSSGNNSKTPGIWYPFDGITKYYGGLWFAKDRYVNHTISKYHRYGTPQFKSISEQLGKLNIPEGNIITEPKELNNFINNKYTRQFNEALDYEYV